MRPCVCVCMCVPRKSEWYECTWNMKWRQVRIEFPPGPYPDRSPDFKKGCSMAKHPLHPPATPSLCLQPFPVLPAFDNCGSQSPHRGGGTGHPHSHAAPQNRTPGGSPTNEPSDTLGFGDLTARWWMYGLSAAETSQAGMAGSDGGPTPLLAALGGWRSSFFLLSSGPGWRMQWHVIHCHLPGTTRRQYQHCWHQCRWWTAGLHQGMPVLEPLSVPHASIWRWPHMPHPRRRSGHFPLAGAVDWRWWRSSGRSIGSRTPCLGSSAVRQCSLGQAIFSPLLPWLGQLWLQRHSPHAPGRQSHSVISGTFWDWVLTQLGGWQWRPPGGAAMPPQSLVIQVIQLHHTATAGDTCHRTWSINRKKVAEALQRPNGITRNCHSPWLMVKAVLGLASGANSTCQYPLRRSSQVKSPLFI